MFAHHSYFQSSWNPGLLSTQPETESSDFDSSDSENDSLPGDTDTAVSPSAQPKIKHTPLVSSTKALAPTSQPTPETVKASESTIKPVSRSLGGALKTGADGQAVAPKVLPRRQKMVSGDLVITTDYSKPLGRFTRLEDADMSSDEGSSGSHSSDEGSLDGHGSESDSGPSDDEGSDSEDNQEEDSEEGSTQPVDEDLPKKRALGFKAWALKQMGQETPTQSPKPFASSVRKGFLRLSRAQSTAKLALGHEATSIWPTWRTAGCPCFFATGHRQHCSLSTPHYQA